MTTFIHMALAGEVEMDEIDDFVDAWHDSVADDGSLATFLGMTEEEYAAWVVNPDALPHIISAHRTGKDFKTSLQTVYERRLAARSDSPLHSGA